MLSKQTIKFISSLRYNKYRLKYNCFIVEGFNSVNVFLNSKFKIHSIFCTQDFVPKYNFDTISIVTQRDLKKISSLKNPPPVLAIFYRPFLKFDFLKMIKQKKIILLDSISDPGNLGSMIRTADWFGVKSLYISKNCVDIFNPKVVQATMGSLSRVKIYSSLDLEAILIRMKQNNINLYGASLSGTSIYKLKKDTQCAIVFGSESHGINMKIQKLIDTHLLIPPEGEFIDSLNVSVAFGIILSEFR